VWSSPFPLHFPGMIKLHPRFYAGSAGRLFPPALFIDSLWPTPSAISVPECPRDRVDFSTELYPPPSIAVRSAWRALFQPGGGDSSFAAMRSRDATSRSVFQARPTFLPFRHPSELHASMSVSRSAARMVGPAQVLNATAAHIPSPFIDIFPPPHPPPPPGGSANPRWSDSKLLSFASVRLEVQVTLQHCFSNMCTDRLLNTLPVLCLVAPEACPILARHVQTFPLAFFPIPPPLLFRARGSQNWLVAVLYYVWPGPLFFLCLWLFRR